MRRFILLLLLLLAFPSLAQNYVVDPSEITFDEVNAVAERMYCPVCEFEPLDTCQTTTCVEWRATIRDQLAQGRTPDEIINYFVANYGDRVVGIPKDPFLELLSLAGPLLVLMLAAVVSFWTFLRWRRNQRPQLVEVYHHRADDPEDDDYRTRLESDLL